MPSAACRRSAQADTTRIEPRPFYGATVTIEDGVRVFRPLPPHDRIIIVNPGGTTPLHTRHRCGGRAGFTAGNAQTAPVRRPLSVERGDA